MKSILPPDGGPIAVTSAGLTPPVVGGPTVLVLVEIAGGPFITLTPHQWDALVDRIRRAPTLRELRA